MNTEPPKPSTLPGTAEDFLAVADQFHLGALTTEESHPDTTALSQLAAEDLPQAVATLKAVDLEALARLEEYAPTLEPLAVAMEETLRAGKRIFLCGCGATGRLSISLETFSRAGFFGEGLTDRVIGFMAGGDAALVRSIERFEDYPAYGVRQLDELGFEEGDLLVGITEGGETPFVIGATEEAARRSSNHPFFVYCNPDDVLAMAAPRSKRVLENDAIRKINLTVGPMAITGSTRMQASTVQMAAVGWALAERQMPERIREQARLFREWVLATDWGFLPAFIAREAAAYEEGQFVLYEPGEFGITVLTDTTERSPTFSLPPFENMRKPDDATSWCYLHVKSDSSAAAWKSILGRAPRTLEWGGLEHLTGSVNLLGFDFSEGVVARRERAGAHLHFAIENQEDAIALRLAECAHRIPADGESLFARHLHLKLILNTHSTLVMGRRGRFEGNVMTHVNATNNKLIDRAIRYVRMLLKRKHGLEVGYEAVARALFEVRKDLGPEEPIVPKAMARILGGRAA